jgi:tetratricopeptide (TPR) repeat protein
MADAFLNLGNLLLEAERYHDAIAAYQQALAVRPNFEKAMHGLRSAQQAQAARVPVSPARPSAPVTGSAAETAQELNLGATQSFANIVDRAEAMETLREACGKQEESCREIARVIEHELGPAIRDLSRSLVGTPAAGELELHVHAYEKSLENLREARKNLDGGVSKIRELGARFAAAAQSPSLPVA